MFELSQRFFFESAHTLHRELETASSRRIHGHTYHAEITVKGRADPVTGMVVDIGFLKQAIERVRLQLDHHFLDEIPALGAATLENLCVYIWNQLALDFPLLYAVRVWREASGDSCCYHGQTFLP